MFSASLSNDFHFIKLHTWKLIKYITQRKEQMYHNIDAVYVYGIYPYKLVHGIFPSQLYWIFPIYFPFPVPLQFSFFIAKYWINFYTSRNSIKRLYITIPDTRTSICVGNAYATLNMSTYHLPCCVSNWFPILPWKVCRSAQTATHTDHK